MSDSKNAFNCNVVNKEVTVISSISIVRAGFPPVKNFVSCSDISSCGVEKKHSDSSSSFNWHICPWHRTFAAN